MAFEAVSKEVLDNIHDPGIYYVYEQGQLRAPPGYSRSCGDDSPARISIEHFYPSEATYSGVTGLHNPPSLLHICSDFVADRIELVDSFEGFPELIGECLFKRVIKKGTLSSPTEKAGAVLKKFSESYGGLVCNKFVLRDKCVGLEKCTDVLIQCFSTLTVLDLHGCKLGDDHDLLRFISELKSLEKLGLSRNALSDRGMQKLTTPLRLFTRGPVALETLDLSENPDITDGVIRCIVCFPKLCQLDLTRTCLTKSGMWRLEQKSCLVRVELGEVTTKPCVLGRPCMEGWATEVLERWIHDAHPLLNQPGLLALQHKPKSSFYGSKQRKLHQVLQFHEDTLRKDAEKLTALNQEILIFNAKKNSDCAPLDGSESIYNVSQKNQDVASNGTNQNRKSGKLKSPDNQYGKRKGAKRISYSDTLSLVTHNAENENRGSDHTFHKRKRIESLEQKKRPKLSESNKKRTECFKSGDYSELSEPNKRPNIPSILSANIPSASESRRGFLVTKNENRLKTNTLEKPGLLKKQKVEHLLAMNQYHGEPNVTECRSKSVLKYGHSKKLKSSTKHVSLCTQSASDSHLREAVSHASTRPPLQHSNDPCQKSSAVSMATPKSHDFQGYSVEEQDVMMAYLKPLGSGMTDGTLDLIGALNSQHKI